MTVRPATEADAHAIAAVHVASWRAGYRGLVPETLLGELSVRERADRWREWMREAAVLVTGEPVAGFVAYTPATAEIAAMYVTPDRWRRGLGTALLTTAHDGLRAAGRARARLWVFEDNVRARAFYAAHGYAHDGGRDVHGRTGLAEIRLLAAL